MDKSDNYSHSISIGERKNINISGVKKIESFDNEEFLLETSMGFLVVKGNDLELVKLDTLMGNVIIKGFFISMAYIDKDMNKDKGNNLFAKLFK
ncbi:MAG: sporulation protein YabP [Bacilli bacterium]